MTGKEYQPEQFQRTQNGVRMFQGSRPIAYLDDLQHLHNEIAHWLVGNQDKFGYYGYLPLLPDGTIDPKYFKAQMVGVDVYKDAENIGLNCKQLVFKGTRVKVFRDEDGKIVVYLPKNQIYSHLGQIDGQRDGRLQLTQQSASQLMTMICPIGSEDYYHGFTPGMQMQGFHALHTDKIVFKTKNPVIFKDAENTKLVVSLLDTLDRPIFTVQTARITGNNNNLGSTVLMGDNRFIKIQITDFTDFEFQYAATVTITVDLKQALPRSRGFKLTVTHYNDQRYQSEINSWTSPDYFYLTGGDIPVDQIDLFAKIYINSNLGTPVVKRISGVRYVTDGYVQFTIYNIKNINADAIYNGTRILFQTNLTDTVYEYQPGDLSYGDQLQLSVAAVGTLKIRFKIKQGLMYPIDNITAKLTVKNAYCEVTKYFEHINIKHQTSNAVINTKPNSRITNQTTQAFDGTVFIINDTNFAQLIPSIQSQENLLNSQQLQVVPNVGLGWPDLFGNKNLNYQRRYFRCHFTGDDTDTSLVWGGTFIFGNLTLAQFNQNDFNVRISLDDGAHWYNLKNGKDCDDQIITTYNVEQQISQTIEGIFCYAEEKDGAVAVRFALPEDQHFNHTDIICFELCMKSTCQALLTYIELKNQDNTGDY